MNRIGFIQGRLSPLVNGCIQAFPWSNWKQEYKIAEQNDFHLMEWTLDQDRLYENPLLTRDGQEEILALCQRHKMTIPSLTGDCFMQAPFWKAKMEDREQLERDFRSVAAACVNLGISIIVVPLVDNGRLENLEQEDILVSYLERQTSFLRDNDLRIVFESDFRPTELARFIERLDLSLFGINYDIGNSAALGFDPIEEFDAYGKRIVNVHIKDRVLGGSTVPLGSGSANFETVFAALARTGYNGNYILQTARATDDDHAGALCCYRDMVSNWIKHYGT